MGSNDLKQAILPVLGVAAGALVFGALSDYPEKYVIGICFTSAVAIFSIIMKKNTAWKQAILSVFCFAAGSVIVCVSTNRPVLGICILCAVSIAASFAREQRKEEKCFGFPHK